MSHCEHQHAGVGHSSLYQSLDELDFEKGIWSAALYGDQCRVEKLLGDGRFEVDARDSAGYTALHYAAREGHHKICGILLQNGAQVDARTRAGQATPLHRAASRGKKNICKLLVQHGADIRTRDGDGKTAYERAVVAGHSDAASYLRETELAQA